MAKILYGSGLRLVECIRLRVKDIDFEQHSLIVREGKGEKDRLTMLPEILIVPLQEHLARVQQIHQQDIKAGYGAVYLPYALEKKYPNAPREWAWQYVFPAKSLSIDPRSNVMRRHHADESGLQKAVRAAARLAGIADKSVSCHTFRHSFATHLLPSGYDTQHLRSGQVFARFRNSLDIKLVLSLPKGRENYHDLHPRLTTRRFGCQKSPR